MPITDNAQLATRLQAKIETLKTQLLVQTKATEHTTGEACAYFCLIAKLRTRAAEAGDMETVAWIDEELGEVIKR